MRSWVRRSLAAALLAWCVVSAVSALRTALSREVDERPEIEAAFGALAADLPPRGVVGYLEPVRPRDDEAAGLLHAAQYALVPRVVSVGVGPEFLIVPRGAAPGEDDPRLAGYEPAGGAPGGHRVYRRAR
jgi:hypothetical protein